MAQVIKRQGPKVSNNGGVGYIFRRIPPLSAAKQYKSMDFQQDHQKNSTTVWSTPQTDEQRRYYSKHAAERRVYGTITTVFQFIHGALAVAAWATIFMWVFSRIPVLIPFAPVLAIISLMTLHVLFRTTWETYWYDKLDQDPKTDSPVWVPALIILLLLGTEIYGTRQFLAGQIKPPQTKSVAAHEESMSNELKRLEDSYNLAISRISATYGEKEKATTLPYDRKLRKLRSQMTEGNTSYIKSQIAQTESAKQNALSPIASAKAAAQERALQSLEDAKKAAETRRDEQVASIDDLNALEASRYISETGSVNTYAWAISLFLLALICGLSYRTVRINVVSGILPIRTYTELDAHGSIPERIWTALSDAFNRRSLQLAVWIHRVLSPKKAITSFDGTVVAKPGTYNTITEEKTVTQPSTTIVTGFKKDELLDSISRQEIQNRAPIGFHKPQSTVTQLPQPVTQQNADFARLDKGNEVVKHYLTELQREPSNFNNPSADKKTVYNRIEKKIKLATEAFGDLPENAVMGAVFFKFDKFATGALQEALEKNGFDLSEEIGKCIKILKLKTLSRVEA